MSITDALLAFSLAAVLLTITPGLDTALILRTAASEGRKQAWQAAIGINLGCFLWGAMIAFGLGALLATSELAYTILKWCGALYLSWLGLQMIVRPRERFELAQSDGKQSNNWFIRGMLGNLLNPKIGVFYISFLPQFIPVNHSPIAWTFILVMIHIALTFVWFAMLISATQRIGRVLKRPKFTQWMDRITGGVFILFAVKLAMSKAS